MRLAVLTRVLFILYCLEAGAILLLTPWGGAWERIVVQVPLPELRNLLLHPMCRGAISGFGLVHLVWGAHDLDQLLSKWRPRRRST